MMKFDLHMHTRRYSPDSDIDPFDLVRRRSRPEGIVITGTTASGRGELDELRRARRVSSCWAVSRCPAEWRPVCYGVSDLTNLRRMAWGELCRRLPVKEPRPPTRTAGQDFDGRCRRAAGPDGP